MKNCLVPHGYFHPDSQGEPARVKFTVMTDMQDGAILDIGPRPDLDGIHITTRHHPGPQRNILINSHRTDYQRGFIHVG